VNGLATPEHKGTLIRILQYHIVPGKIAYGNIPGGKMQTIEGHEIGISVSSGGVRVDDAKIVIRDKSASNGMVHGIDKVLIPSSVTQELSLGSGKEESVGYEPDLLVLLAGDAKFSILTSLIFKAGLQGLLQGSGPYTIFAPSDEAFKSLPAGTVNGLATPEHKGTLIRILQYHIVPGKIAYGNIPGGKMQTIEGHEIGISVSSGGVRVDDAKIVIRDKSASNGMVHGIDKVLIPSSVTQELSLGSGKLMLESDSARFSESAEKEIIIEQEDSGKTIHIYLTDEMISTGYSFGLYGLAILGLLTMTNLAVKVCRKSKEYAEVDIEDEF